MEVIEILKKAVALRKPILYEYEVENRAVGIRKGHPHAIFVSTSENVNIDIFKVDGVMSDPSKPLPDWRQYKVIGIRNVVILENESEFEIALGYKPESIKYLRYLEKI